MADNIFRWFDSRLSLRILKKNKKFCLIFVEVWFVLEWELWVESLLCVSDKVTVLKISMLNVNFIDIRMEKQRRYELRCKMSFVELHITLSNLWVKHTQRRKHKLCECKFLTSTLEYENWISMSPEVESTFSTMCACYMTTDSFHVWENSGIERKQLYPWMIIHSHSRKSLCVTNSW